MTNHWLIYALPEEVYAFDQNECWGVVVNVQPRQPLSVGHNAVVAPNDGFVARFILRESGADPCSPTPLTLFQDRPDGQDTALGFNLTEGAFAMFLIIEDGDRGRLYQNYETNGKSSYFLALGDVPKFVNAQDCLNSIQHLALAHGPKINNRRVRQKWKADCELERKYTFAHVLQSDTWSKPSVNIWGLSRALHEAVGSGRLPGWIPEFNDEFHLWHYGSEIFEVTGPPTAQGYLAFIPQTDGNTTLKYKRFQQDAELRFESIAHHLPVQPDGYAQEAQKVSGGTTHRLPGFRRTRFDVDLESLETGNAFAIVVDISRPFDDSNALLSQSEVEYIRTRSVGDPKDVMADFETVCCFVGDVFQSVGADYVQTPYSKLSFLRDVSQPQAVEAAE